MKKDLKQNILLTANKLFNQYGYNNVSMRQIAKELNIGVGNLTYHYKKKEDIVIAIISNLNNDRDRTDITSLYQFSEALYCYLERCINYSWYFQHVNIFADNKDFLNSNNANIKLLKDRLINGLIYCQSKGYIKKDISKESIDALVTTMMLMHMSFTNKMYAQPLLKDNDVYTVLKLHWDILIPYLTASGIKEYNKFKDSKF